MKNGKRINIITLGCAKNTVDSEHLAAQLVASGFEVLFDSDDQTVRTAVVNTCGFIGDAKEESVNTILSLAEAKTNGLLDSLYVFGCLSQRYPEELRGEIPEVDAFFGVDNMPALTEALGAAYLKELETGRVLSTPQHYAYLKISEGCDRSCTYCIIPKIRGRHRSVPTEELLAEARLLTARGVKELLVIAQDTTYYGLDLYGERRLAALLRELCRIDGIEWVRLHYAYPAHFPQDVIDVLREEPKMCKYLDIPLQHIADGQLRSMKRGIGGAATEDLIARLRAGVPGIALRTTFLVGYPGESEEDFALLCRFVEKIGFERLGVFPYSAEEGTHSADRLADDVPQSVKEKRAARLIELQSGISFENNQKTVGRVERVIIDRREGDLWVGRTQYDSPEVDQDVFVKSRKELCVGSFCDVKITDAQEYDLWGEVV